MFNEIDKHRRECDCSICSFRGTKECDEGENNCDNCDNKSHIEGCIDDE
jgi:hypothetical protein